MEITVLLENESRRKGFNAAHGLSVWVREGDTRLLFDTGPDDSLLGNAKAQSIDLASVTALVLSHNHWDHTGGVMPLLKYLERPLPVYVGKDFFREKYAQDGADRKSLSNLDRQALVERNVTFTEVGMEPLPLGGRLYLLSGWDAPYPYEPANGRFVIKRDDEWMTDPFTEEIVLVYAGNEELTMLTGCSHPGIAGMVRKASKAFDKPVHTLLGGAHLMSAEEDRVQKTAATLSELGVKVLGLAHCSGERIGEVWKKKQYGAVAAFHGGDRVVVEVR